MKPLDFIVSFSTIVVNNGFVFLFSFCSQKNRFLSLFLTNEFSFLLSL